MIADSEKFGRSGHVLRQLLFLYLSGGTEKHQLNLGEDSRRFVENRTEHLLNKSLEGYHYNDMFGYTSS
jgi:hypothetical protein